MVPPPQKTPSITPATKLALYIQSERVKFAEPPPFDQMVDKTASNDLKWIDAKKLNLIHLDSESICDLFIAMDALIDPKKYHHASRDHKTLKRALANIYGTFFLKTSSRGVSSQKTSFKAFIFELISKVIKKWMSNEAFRETIYAIQSGEETPVAEATAAEDTAAAEATTAKATVAAEDSDGEAVETSPEEQEFMSPEDGNVPESWEELDLV
jgi:hypothetical protein